MEGYTESNLFQSQDSSLDNDNEIPQVEEPTVSFENEAITEHHQQKSEPDPEQLIYDDGVKYEKKEQISIWDQVCNMDNMVLILLVILLAILYMYYI